MASTTTDGPRPRPWLRLFALSFIALFLELMVIRWAPAAVHTVSYYTNLMLISSFLGLGLGALLAPRRWELFRWFPLLLAGGVGFLLLCGHVLLPGSATEYRFAAGAPRLANYLVLIGIFTSNVATFVPLGQEIGRMFRTMVPLRAYAWDLGGSLCGTVAFGLFSFYSFSPLIGMLAIAALYLALARGRGRLWAVPLFAATLLAMRLATNPRAIWSPYHYIQLNQVDLATGRPGPSAAAPRPAVELRTMSSPPFYSATVNHMFYQLHGTLDGRRYPGDAPGRHNLEEVRGLYLLPYRLLPAPQRVAVIGSGGGLDVEAALLSGAQQVDAVDVDPVLVALSRRYSASGVYDDPRVDVRIDDARAFLRRAPTAAYDLVVFGLLDSHGLSSFQTNLRLDGYVYTVESIRSAYRLLDDDGVLVLTFGVGNRLWLVHKLAHMVAAATGQQPLVYYGRLKSFIGSVLFLAVSRAPIEAPLRLAPFDRIELAPVPIPLATDDWPYLYLMLRTVPRDYAIVIGTLLLVSLLGLLSTRPGGFGSSHLHFMFLGMAFLLLQAKSVVDCALYFGATWLVTTLVVAGVLLMVLAANLVAQRLPGFSSALYLPLLASLLMLYLVPRDTILAWPFLGRLAWTLTAVPLPLFFAGLIFSTTFAEAENPSATFGSNLIGAMLGGFAEYLGMAVGNHNLSLLVMVAYLASYLSVHRARSGARAGVAAALAAGAGGETAVAGVA